MTQSARYLRSAQAARRLGVSGKALRLYEAHGLVRAERTAAGWRVYGPDQLARLHQVLALRRFGFPLARIAELLAGGVAELGDFLALHETELRRERARIDRALALLAAARARLAAHGALSPDDLTELTKETSMSDHIDEIAAAYEAAVAKHLTPQDQATLAANGGKPLTQPDVEWDALHAEAAQLMATGDPRSPEAIDLARRWMGKVFEGTGGDPALTRKVRDVARESLEQPAFAAASSSSTAMMDFVGQAYGAAIEAGMMPPPDRR